MAERYENDRWRDDERDPGRDRDDRGRWFDRDRGADRDRWSERDRGDRGMMARGADEVRSWFGDDRAERRREIDELHDRANEWRDRPRWSQGARPSGIGREWPGRSSEAAWEGGGRIDRSTRDYPGDYERGRFLRDRSDRSPWGDFDPDGRARGGDGPSASAADRHRSGYYDSSMGYASVPTAGGLNPFRYGGPGSFAGRGPRNYQRSDERIRE
ncbi:MAG: SWFGD domain-containing protein, partial [Vicinamibacterales bacterium]